MAKKKRSTGDKVQQRTQRARNLTGMTLRQLYEQGALEQGVEHSEMEAALRDHEVKLLQGKVPDPPKWFRTHINNIGKQQLRRKYARAA